MVPLGRGPAGHTAGRASVGPRLSPLPSTCIWIFIRKGTLVHLFTDTTITWVVPGQSYHTNEREKERERAFTAAVDLVSTEPILPRWTACGASSKLRPLLLHVIVSGSLSDQRLNRRHRWTRNGRRVVPHQRRNPSVIRENPGSRRSTSIILPQHHRPHTIHHHGRETRGRGQMRWKTRMTTSSSTSPEYHDTRRGRRCR